MEAYNYQTTGIVKNARAYGRLKEGMKFSRYHSFTEPNHHMQQKPEQERRQSHDVDETNREGNEKTPPASFTGTNTDRYVAGETMGNPEQEKNEENKAGGKNKE